MVARLLRKSNFTVMALGRALEWRLKNAPPDERVGVA
jgi:hypothetical protein